MCMKQVYLQLKIISMDVNVPRLASFAADMCRSLSISDKKTMYLCFVIETVLEMRMKQLNADNPYIEIEVAKDRETIFVSIKDKGLPYVLTDNQRRLIASGLVNGYKLEQLGSEGQRIVFWLRQDEFTELTMPELEEEELLDDDISIYRTQPTDEDANEIVRCFFSTYGYNYFHQTLYRLDELRRMLRGGHYVSLLARNAHGQTLGHLALSEEEEELPGLYEYCNLITKPFARGKGIAKKLSTQAVNTISTLDNAEGSYMLGAAFHTATAKLSNIAGYTPTGFFLQFTPHEYANSVYWKGDARLSCFFAVTLRNKERLHRLYLAEEIRAFSEAVFSKEQLNYTVVSPETLPAECRISINVDTYLRSVKLYVDECNEELNDRIDALFGGSEMQGMEMVIIFLNANQSGAVDGYTTLRKKGFVFSGLLPGSTRGDFIVLQRFLKMPLDRKTLTLEPNYEKLLDELMEINGAENGILV